MVQRYEIIPVTVFCSSVQKQPNELGHVSSFWLSSRQIPGPMAGILLLRPPSSTLSSTKTYSAGSMSMLIARASIEIVAPKTGTISNRVSSFERTMAMCLSSNGGIMSDSFP